MTVHLYIEIPQGEIWEYFNGPYICISDFQQASEWELSKI